MHKIIYLSDMSAEPKKKTLLKEFNKITHYKYSIVLAVLFLYTTLSLFLGYTAGPGIYTEATVKPGKCYLNSLVNSNASSTNATKNIENCGFTSNLKNITEGNFTISDVIFVFPFSRALHLQDTFAAGWIVSFNAFLLFNRDHKVDYFGVDKAVRLPFIADLAYKEDSKLTVKYKSIQTRMMNCETESDRYIYGCNYHPLFELASVNHEDYQLHIRFPVLSAGDYLHHARHFQNLQLRVFYENVKFTKEKTCLKGIQLLILVIGSVAFFRSVQRKQKNYLLEKTMMTHTLITFILNIPFELLPGTWSLALINTGQMYMYTVSLFYTWLIFYGSYTKDTKARNTIDSYCIYLVPFFNYTIIFMIDHWEKASVMTDPFYAPGCFVQLRKSPEFRLLAVMVAMVFLFYVYNQSAKLWKLRRLVTQVLYKGGYLPFVLLQASLLLAIINAMGQFVLDQISVAQESDFVSHNRCFDDFIAMAIPALSMCHFGMRCALNFTMNCMYLPVCDSLWEVKGPCKIQTDVKKAEEYFFWMSFDKKMGKRYLTVSTLNPQRADAVKVNFMTKKDMKVAEPDDKDDLNDGKMDLLIPQN